MFRFAQIVCFAACASLTAAHTIITYPGWRGNNIHTNGTVSDDDHSIIPGSLGINYDKDKDTYGFPFGMQWIYPCGGMPTSKNRTKWPLTGGAVAIQPGWFPGHSMAQIYINMGFGNEPLNYSHAMVNGFSIVGPTNQQYNGTFCLPQVPLPLNYTPKVGDNATIQVIELAQHGASLFNCADITFAEPGDPSIPEVNQTNCFNSTEEEQKIGFQLVYTMSSAATPSLTVTLNAYAAVFVPLMLGAASWLTWL